MRILILSPYPILPPLHGSRVRTARLAEGLARAGATVDLLCPWYPGQPRNGRIADAFNCHSHFLISNLLPQLLPWLAAPQALLSFQPPPRRLLKAFATYDVFQFDFCAHASWMSQVPRGAKIVYSAHNVEKDYCRSDSVRYALARASLSRIERLERLAARRSDLIVTCTEKDAARLRQHYGDIGPTMVVPNGCAAELLGWEPSRVRAGSRASLGLHPHQRAILFIGGDASHNRQAVEFLVAKVVPQLDENAVLLVVGKCAAATRHKDLDRRVRLLDFVADLRPLLAAADVAVNPVDRDSGSSVKLMEYLAAGLAVVSTPIGVRGLGQVPAGVRIAEREQFAEVLRAPLPVAAADRAELANLTWEQLGRNLLRRYERLGGSAETES